jgi:hypothetical protein
VTGGCFCSCDIFLNDFRILEDYEA